MPELRQPDQPQYVNLEEKDYTSAEKQLEDAAAVSLVVSTFTTYETWRKSNQDKRWLANESMYFGYLEKRKWKGTDVDRASLAVPIVYDQVEAAYPIIMDALFAYYPRFFQVSPVGGTQPRDAASVEGVLASKFDTPIDDNGLKPETHFGIALKQVMVLGDGVVEVSWDGERKLPVVEWVDLKDVYMDSETNTPQIDASPAVIHRKMMTVDELRSLRGTSDNIYIPSDSELNALAKMRFDTASEAAKKAAASLRNQTVQTQLRDDPRYQTVEVLKYWTKDKLIWVLGRTVAAINTKNPYGFIPYCKAPFTLIPGQAYSMGLADVLEGDQKYAQGIRNARLDNLALSMNPPRIRVAGAAVSPSATAWRPGLEEKVAKADDVQVVKVENFTADGFREEQLIHAQAAKRTGVNDFAQSGMPMPSNANRSATGVSQQVRTISQRLSTAVKNFEDFIIIPTLYKVLKLMVLYSPESFQINDAQGQPINISKDVLSSPVKFSVRAASRMIAREKLTMLLAPLTQILFNDVVMKQANTQGKTLDFEEFDRFLQDASNTAESYKFFRPMTPQEMQRQQQPDPKTMMDMERAKLEAQTRMQMGQMKAQSEKDKTIADAKVKMHETGEKSAREILKLLQAERQGKLDAEATKQKLQQKAE